MANPDPEEGFRVTDRRRHSEAEPAVSSPPPGPPPPAGAAPAEPVRTSPPPGGAEAPAEGEDRSLAGLFMMLASSAVVALGDAPDPLTGEVHAEPEQAAESIDLLVLLREKTEGNLTAEESQLLESIIYDLQLRYINAVKRS